MFRPSLPLTTTGAQAALAEGVRAIAEGAQSFDLAGVPATDSAGVAILLSWQRAAQTRNARLSFINPPVALRSLAALYGVDALLGLEADPPRH